jgi:acyl-CoA thioesterase II
VVSDDPCTHADPEPGCCLIRQLRLTRAGESEFAGRLRGGRSDPGRAFGGCLIGQALLAAGATVPGGLLPGSLHAYFLSPGKPGEPVRYRVGRLRDGRSSAVRQVTAEQDGVTRLVMLTAFRASAESAEHQRVSPALGMPPPAVLGPGPACRCDTGDLTCGLAVHAAAPPEAEPGGAADAHRATWLRLRHGLGGRPLWQAAVLSYMSDLATIRTVDQPYRHEGGRRVAASVDHAVWFHRPFRADEWLCYWQRSPVYTGGRGMSLGEFYDPAGQLVASTAQEVALRRMPESLRRQHPRPSTRALDYQTMRRASNGGQPRRTSRAI